METEHKNNGTGRFKNVKYPVFAIILMVFCLVGCNTYDLSKNVDYFEENKDIADSDDKESKKMDQETTDTNVDKEEGITESESSNQDKEEETTESNSSNQEKKNIFQEPDFAKSAEWDKYEPVDATDMILQIGDVFIRYGDTVGEIFKQFEKSKIPVSTETDLNSRGDTEPVEIIVFKYDEILGNIVWLTITAEEPTVSWTQPVSDYQIINVELSDDAKENSYLLDGKYFSEIRAMSYDDVLNLKGNYFPDNIFEMYEDVNVDGYYTITYISERDKDPLLIPNATRINKRIQTERKYVFTFPQKSGTVLYYEERPTKEGWMILIDP